MSSVLDPESKIRRAFDQVYDRYPYFASIVQGWKVIQVTCACTTHALNQAESLLYGPCTHPMPTAATDGPRMWYNTKFIDRLKIADVTALILHEAMHIFCGHHMRFEGKDVRTWNVAADLAGNDYIIIHIPQDGALMEMACIPGKGKFAHLPRKMDAEFYLKEVEKMREEMRKQQGQGQGKGQGTQGSGKPQKGEKGEGEGQGSGEGDDGLPRSIGEVLPHPSSGDAEAMEEAKQEWEQDVARAVRTAKSCGNMPGWLEEIANELYGNEPDEKVNWKAYLKRFAIKNVPVGGQTFQRLNRRFGHRRDIIIPAEQSKQAANGVMLVDVSGSMRQAEMDLGIHECSDIFAAYRKVAITMMQADTRLIADGEKLFQKRDLPLKVPHTWYGRGGTNLVGAIEQIGKMAGARRWRYLIIISDMEWNYTEAQDPHIPTIWITTQQINQEVPFGMAIGPIMVKD